MTRRKESAAKATGAASGSATCGAVGAARAGATGTAAGSSAARAAGASRNRGNMLPGRPSLFLLQRMAAVRAFCTEFFGVFSFLKKYKAEKIVTAKMVVAAVFGDNDPNALSRAEFLRIVTRSGAYQSLPKEKQPSDHTLDRARKSNICQTCK
jgi:hypothetical protein